MSTMKATDQRTIDLEESHARLMAMMPLFQEARDALCAITAMAAKLHHISPTLADRMDDVGIPERWRKQYRGDAIARAEGKE